MLGFLGINQLAHAQAERFNIQRLAFHEKIDQKQKFIDGIDGTVDERVSFKDERITHRATRTYIELIDSIQQKLEDQNVDGVVTYEYILNLYGVVNRIRINNYNNLDYYEAILQNIYDIIKHKDQEDFLLFLSKDMRASIRNVVFYKELPEAEDFLLKAVQLYPNEVLKEIKNFAQQQYALKVVEKAARVSPMAVKKYFNSKNIVNNFVQLSQDSVVHKIVDLYHRFGNESKVFYFLDMIINQEVQAEVLHSVARNPRAYLGALIQAKQKDQPIGDYDLNNELSVKALEEVRKVNDLHEVADSSVRFAAVRNMNAAELYTLMVYSPEEIFTSTFNGLFERLLRTMKNEELSGYDLLEQINYNKFRTFIKQCAGYGNLETFLATMPEENALTVLRKFVSELNTDDGDISEAVNVADTFGSLEELEFLTLFEQYLQEEFQELEDDDNNKILYGLLLKLLYQKMDCQPEYDLQTALESYNLPPIEQVDFAETDSTQNTTQMHFFFDDDDGIVSYQTFISSFRSAGFKIEDHPYYVIISSTGKSPTTIYANKPKYEREGQAELNQMVEDDIIQPSIIVHRGHSYYVNYTLNSIPSYAKVVFLGSCGGYHNISEVIKRAPQAHIIASKQIGTYTVNNTMLVEMSKAMNQDNILNWTPLWNNLDRKLKGSGQSYSRFLDYVPPHRNLGAIFIQSYNRLTQEKSQQDF